MTVPLPIDPRTLQTPSRTPSMIAHHEQSCWWLVKINLVLTKLQYGSVQHTGSCSRAHRRDRISSSSTNLPSLKREGSSALPDTVTSDYMLPKYSARVPDTSSNASDGLRPDKTYRSVIHNPCTAPKAQCDTVPWQGTTCDRQKSL